MLILFGGAVGYLWSMMSAGGPVGQQSRIEQITNLLQHQYVDSLNPDEVEETAIRKYLATFDPHSVFIPYRYVDLANQDLKGGFEGIGIEFFMLGDTPYVVRVIEDGPAFKAGVKPGDRLLVADTTSLIGMDNTDIVQHLKGNGGEGVSLQVYRIGFDERKQFEVIRGSIAQPSVYSFMVDQNTAYFTILHFAEPTHTEFTTQLAALKRKGDFNNIILDLRNNPGGYLKTAIDLLDEFVDGTDVLAYTRGANAESKTFKATPGGLCSKLKLICLVNEHSASASEIFSGAIQDLDRGLVMGHQTFGKGLVQETFQLQDKSQVRLTVSRYYIPSGRCIQKPYDEEGYVTSDSGSMAKGNEYKTKGGRTVVSDGGIQPDIVLESTSGLREHSAELAVDVLDELNIKNLVQPDAPWNEWWHYRKVVDVIHRRAMNDTLQRNLQARLCYQLYGPKAELEVQVSYDPWIKQAQAQFGSHSILLNP